MKSTYKIVLISFLGVALSGILYLALIKPTLNQIVNLNTQAVAKKTELNTLLDQINAYKNARTDLSQASAKDLVNNAILKRENLETAIKTIESAASTTGTDESLNINDSDDSVSKGSVAPDVVTGRKISSEVPYTITASNDFVGLVQFIQYLEHLPHFTEVSKLSFSAKSADSGKSELARHSGKIIGNIEGVFFIKKTK
jgi:hypothetical protein